MDIQVFSDDSSLRKCFDPLNRSRTYATEFKGIDELKTSLKEISSPTVIYLDITSYSDEERRRLLKSLAKLTILRFGILDPHKKAADIAELFHLGAIDYIDAKISSVDATRIRSALSIFTFDEEEETGNKIVQNTEWILSGSTWKGIKSGQEYTFCFLFVEIDLVPEWKEKSGQAHLDQVVASFRKHIERHLEPLKGRIWMWMDLGGVLLFPFDGKKCDSILTCTRLVLNRTTISAEEYDYNTEISYRMVLHIGNTLYKTRGKTGTIISDSINFLFHLGQKYADSGGLYLTEPVFNFAPSGLQNTFISAGQFEGIDIYRMRSLK